ncbi:unnamed protein product [Mytilus edulis]|uniref:EGF-like domain-containing protein n=1 Tax=Mytilus edulis TaxID=6550 RepID=A0A8S3VB32_MYTED|nr:unnamed protein product [Mytilus edulis]
MEFTLSVFVVVISIGLVNGSCPSMCSCSSQSSGLFVQCKFGSLERIPDTPNDTSLLDLSYNSITEIDVQFCKAMPQLQTLYLQQNQISEIPANAFVDCDVLATLLLNTNAISTIEPFTFMNLPNLISIYLHSNKIQSLKKRASIGTSVRCSNGTMVISLRSSELDKCNPDNCKCFNSGKCMTRSNGHVVCECIGNWTGELCQESQCISYDLDNHDNEQLISYTEHSKTLADTNITKNTECNRRNCHSTGFMNM